jgi:hypothetical protein
MRYFKQFIIGFVVIVLTTFSAAAQTSFTSSDGKVSLTLPAGWAIAEDDTIIIIANNLEGLDLGQRRSTATPGTMILLLSATANMSEVRNDHDIAPKEIIEMFMSAMEIEEEIVEASINGFDVVQVAVSNLDTDLSDTEVAIAALETANGTIFMIMETGDTLADYSDELMSIAESLTNSAPSSAVPAESNGFDIAAILGETASKNFGDGTVMNYPLSYTAADSDNTRVEITSPEGGIILHEAIKSFSGVGEEALAAALADAFDDDYIDSTRLMDVFGDGTVLQYQVGSRQYFITYAAFTNSSKLLVVTLSESASQAANDAVLVVAQAIAADMSFVTPTGGSAAPVESTTTEGNTLTYNSSVTGELTDSVTEQLYTFTGTAGDVVTITMVAEDNDELDSWVWLLTSEGFEGDDLVPLVDNDDAADTSVGAYNSQIIDFALPETGEYAIRATRIGSGVGKYTLTLESASAVTESQTDTSVTMVRQWAANANATTQYGSSSWSAGQATGEPNASETCSDNSSAWASATTGTKESITLIYETAVIPSEIHIYQVYNPGSIVEVAVMNSRTGSKVILPNSADPVGNTPCPGVFTIPVSGLAESFDMVTIYLDQSTVASWTEIDAVELVGVDPSTVAIDAESQNSGNAIVNADATEALTVLGADALQHIFSDNRVFTYPASYEVYFTDGRGIQIAGYVRKVTILYTNDRIVQGQGEQAMLELVRIYYSETESLDPSRLVDLFGDGTALQYQPEQYKYFIIYTVPDGNSKLVVVSVSASATAETVQKGLADAKAITRLLSLGQ